MDETVTSIANHDLFVVREEVDQLGKEKSNIFHSTTQKLLYIMKRARPDLETAVSFLMRRVSKSDLDDWGKLKRVFALFEFNPR